MQEDVPVHLWKCFAVIPWCGVYETMRGPFIPPVEKGITEFILQVPQQLDTRNNLRNRYALVEVGENLFTEGLKTDGGEHDANGSFAGCVQYPSELVCMPGDRIDSTDKVHLRQVNLLFSCRIAKILQRRDRVFVDQLKWNLPAGL